MVPWLYVLIAILGGGFTITASSIAINNGNKRDRKLFELGVGNRLIAIETTMKNNNGRCPEHNKSFERIYDKLEENTNKMSEQFEQFNKIAASLDKSVSLFGQRIDAMSAICVARGEDIEQLKLRKRNR